MFLHVGNNKNIRVSYIIGIFDLDNVTVSNVTRNFMSNMQKNNRVESVNEDIPKSFVLYFDKEKKDSKICISQLASNVLIGRINTKKITD